MDGQARKSVYVMIDRLVRRSSRMLNHFIKIFTVAAIFSCAPALAASVTTTPELDATNATRGKASRPLYIYLPESSAPTFQKSTNSGLFANSQNNKSSLTAAKSARDTAPTILFLYLNPETRPANSVALGFLPPKAPVNTSGPYQYAAMDSTSNGCRAVERPPSDNNPKENSENNNKPLRLPIGWSVEMCLHF